MPQRGAELRPPPHLMQREVNSREEPLLLVSVASRQALDVPCPSQSSEEPDERGVV